MSVNAKNASSDRALRWLMPFCGMVLAVTAAGALPGPLDYPLARGTRWVYHMHQELGPGVSFGDDVAPLAKGNVLDVEVVAEVTGTEALGGTTYTRIESTRNGRLWMREWYRLTPESLSQGKSFDAESGMEILMSPPQKLLSATLQPGETWTWRAPDAPVTVRTRVVGVEPVTVKAGNYRATKLDVLTTIPNGASPIRVQQFRWYASGVGFVKQETETRAGARIISRVELTLVR